METKMKKTKNKKYELKSEETKETKKSQYNKKVEPVVSFDVYFQGLVKSRKDVHPHHKAPMKAYAVKYGKLNGTLNEFEKLFKSY